MKLSARSDSSHPEYGDERERVLDRALSFSTRAKLGEVFFESIPQFFTLLIMTSAKGNQGLRELTYWQMISIVTSTVTIAMGVSNYIVENGGRFLARNHSKLATRLVVIIVVSLEVAFCGGISRFSFAFLFDNKIPFVAILTPFISLASLFHIMHLLSDRYLFRFGEFSF